MSSDPKKCPWCERWCLKDAACNYIFACGLEANGKFVVGAGCGGSWSLSQGDWWQCGKKFCGPYYLLDGTKASTARDNHDLSCACIKSDEYCPGGHNSHCEKRW